ncbi:uncharacterized protein LOC114247282 isoform X1 [Bombyx mandarina]|uniref:Uncharacterized protein LOC114247282 isoform X1 n=1 Tax=Bombyx mandarina TaxID=7092 RepID=A0A6J2K281_BOMMA|nr:uncharacterized protein LOC114247282 isoform X1 [Bombyx mandarina]
MGAGASAAASETPGGDLRLPASGLRFTTNQLRTLNSYVETLWEDDQKGRISTETESAVESLVQRIVDGAGRRDPRFGCSHLIALHRGKKMRSRSLEYLVTLDSLPVLNSNDECRLHDGPTGYGRVRLTGRDAEKWEEFLTPAGYLCRDKIVERWVGLVARSAGARGGGAGRALAARAALRAVPNQYCYLERASSGFTSIDRRLAIVEGAVWVMVRVGGGEAEAKLVLGARVQGCHPQAYTTRVPITHPLALLHYTAAQGMYYAVTAGPPLSAACPDRTSTWQLWHPALEATLDAHCSELSTVARIAGALNALVDKMREQSHQGSLRATSRYLVQCALRRRLDRCAGYATAAARCCPGAHASHHLLLVLDSLLSICERGGVAGYVHPTDRGCLVRRGAGDADWDNDAVCIASCLRNLNRVAGEEIPLTPAESLELALFNRWENLNRELKASVGSTSTYSRRQIRYLWRVATELVKCKSMVYSEPQSNFKINLIQMTSPNSEAIEDLIHILAIMLDQARDLYLNGLQSRTLKEFDRETSVYRSKKWNKLKSYYDASSACLIDAVRRDPDLQNQDLTNPQTLMKSILNWLHKGCKEDKKYLAPVLKPYLDGLFNSSLENSWFLEDFEMKQSSSEHDGLKEFCLGVHDGNIDPSMGLLEVAKKYTWAKVMVDFVEKFRHIEFRVVFPSSGGAAVCAPPPPRSAPSSARTLTLTAARKSEAKLRLAERCVIGAFHDALTFTKSGIPRHESEEILASVKSGNYWRNSAKPDIIPSTSYQDVSKLNLEPKHRRSRRNRPVTSYFPEISITKQGDAKTLRRKYHTLKSLVYTEPVESIKELRKRPRSAGSTLRNKEALSRPSLLETLDFINSVKDALSVGESGASDAEESAWSPADEWLVGQTAPLSLLGAHSAGDTLHLALADFIPALLNRGKFTVLQELCARLGAGGEGALLALHRLARAARSRSSERAASSWRLPEAYPSRLESVQTYKTRSPDHESGDEEPPPPPPLPRRSSRRQITYTEYTALPPRSPAAVTNPLYDVTTTLPKHKLTVKRSKSLGRSCSTKLGDGFRTLGHRSRTNDVLTATEGMSGATGVESKGYLFYRYSTADVVGDSYRVHRATIE